MGTIFNRQIRRLVVTLGLAGAIAAGSLALMGSASAAPNNNPTSPHDTLCAAFKGGYDDAVKQYEAATTDAGRAAARQAVYANIDAYYAEGCDIDHGPINFRVQNPDVFQKAGIGGKQLTASPNPTQVGGTAARVK